MKRIALIASADVFNLSYDHIFKDVCLIPTLMKEKFGFEASIVSYGIDAKLVKNFLSGIHCINIDKTENYLLDINYYLEENAKNIDIIYILGPYESYDIITKLYKMYNPRGKIYLKLDMNRYWLNSIINKKYFRNLLEISDLVTVEDRKLQDMINSICNCKVEYLRNGCYKFVKVSKVKYEEKKNVILTVGRLGSEQKATGILIEAFLKANLPNWELRLVGSIEKEFLPVLERYKQNPKFKKQVKVIGRIEDKNILYNEYRKAKIFCMTSQVEGCAHVYTEAGLHGCYIVSTDVDGISDISKYSSIVPVNDLNEITNALENAAKNEELMKKNCYKIQEYIQNEGMWDIIISKLYLLFCSSELIDDLEIDKNEFPKKEISDIPSIVKEIEILNEKLANSNDCNYVVDLIDKIVKYLKAVVIILNNNNEIIIDMSIKNETMLLKDYYINYINGIFNSSEYIIEKYRKNINTTYEKWNKSILNSINNRFTLLQRNLKDIHSIFSYINDNSIEDIIFNLSKIYNMPINKLANMPMGGYGKERTSGAYYFTLKDMKENYKEYSWLYKNLQDKESKQVLTNLCRFRLTCSMQFVKNSFDGHNPQYFDKKIIKCSEDEVFVDCGGFTGDTSKSYIKTYSRYKKIYIYEPSPKNVDDCLKNTSKYENIIVRKAGVGLKKGEISLSREGAASSAVNASGETDVVKIVSIDEDIKDKITFLKMDIEGEEINALKGAKNHILNDKPKLAICVYHIISDLWEIPKLIYSIDQTYRLYLRQYREDQAWETVIYAIH
ncbi:MAG: FkbM family methyltransferase [Clostridium sp.]|nr:FkbM family methyltransferase [Clostridium sp.]